MKCHAPSARGANDAQRGAKPRGLKLWKPLVVEHNIPNVRLIECVFFEQLSPQLLRDAVFGLPQVLSDLDH